MPLLGAQAFSALSPTLQSKNIRENATTSEKNLLLMQRLQALIGSAGDRVAVVTDTDRKTAFLQAANTQLAILRQPVAVVIHEDQAQGVEVEPAPEKLASSVQTQDLAVLVRPTKADLTNGAMGSGKLYAKKGPTIVQDGYMTGDMFGIGMALKKNPLLRLVLIKTGRPDDRTQQLVNYYKEVGVSGQIDFIDETDGGGALAQEIRASKDANTNINGLKGNPKHFFVGPGGATLYLAEQSKRADGQKMTTKLAREHLLALPLNGQNPISGEKARNCFVGISKVDDFNPQKPTVFLWNRASGKRGGGAHIEHDTSHRYLVEQTKKLKADGFNVVLMGDTPSLEKLAEIDPSANMTEFWSDPQFKEMFAGGNPSRTDQFRLIDALSEELLKASGESPVHIGSRSGALESFALMGSDAFYLEEKDNPQRGRMAQWKPAGISYNQTQVDTFSSRTGQIMQIAVKLMLEEGAENSPEYNAERARIYAPIERMINSLQDGSPLNVLQCYQKLEALGLVTPPAQGSTPIDKHPDVGNIQGKDKAQLKEALSKLINSKILSSGVLGSNPQLSAKFQNGQLGGLRQVAEVESTDKMVNQLSDILKPIVQSSQDKQQQLDARNQMLAAIEGDRPEDVLAFLVSYIKKPENLSMVKNSVVNKGNTDSFFKSDDPRNGNIKILSKILNSGILKAKPDDSPAKQDARKKLLGGFNTFNVRFKTGTGWDPVVIVGSKEYFSSLS